MRLPGLLTRVLVGGALLLATVTARADTDAIAPWASQQGPGAIFLNPALLAAGDGAAAELSAYRPRGTDSGSHPVQVRAFLGGRHLGIGYAAGEDFLPWKHRVAVALAWGGRTAGFGISTEHTTLTGTSDWHSSRTVGAFLRPIRQLGLEAAAAHLEDESGVPRTYSAGVALRPAGEALTLGADVRFQSQAYDLRRVRLALSMNPSSWLGLDGSYTLSHRGFPAEGRLGVRLLGGHTTTALTYRAVEHRDSTGSAVPGSGGSQGVHLTWHSALHAGGLEKKLGRASGSLTLRGPYAEQPSGWSLLGSSASSLPGCLRALREAGADASRPGLLLRIESQGGGLLGPLTADLEELRGEIFRFRSTGRPVVAYLDAEIQGPAEMFLASACDVVVVPRLATVAGLGVAVEVRRLKGMFEKLGVKFEHATAGEYKSTFHSFYTDTTAAVQREELQSLVHQEYEVLVGAVASGRHLDLQRARELCDGRGLTAAEARAVGLVDRLGWLEDAEEELAQRTGCHAPVRPVVVERIEELRWGVRECVAIVPAEGEITGGRDAANPLFGGMTLGATSLCERLEAAARLPGVRAIVLRVNTGGGSSLASERIRRTLLRIREKNRLPIVASMGASAASGGYLISAPADEIWADSLTVTGSIGVVWFLPTFQGLYDKLGARREVYKEGEHSDAFLMGREFSEAEREQLERIVHSTYEDFLDVVAEGRHLSREEVRKVAQGRIWFGAKASTLGLVDHLGGVRQAVEAAARRAGIKGDYRTVEVGRPRAGLLSRLLSGASAQLSQGISGISLEEWR